jgi:phage-related protein
MKDEAALTDEETARPKPLRWIGSSREELKSMKGIATPKHDIDLIKTRLKVATEHHAKEKKGQKQ